MEELEKVDEAQAGHVRPAPRHSRIFLYGSVQLCGIVKEVLPI